MLTLTLRVIQGADRGRIFADLKPPITVGREEGNTIQLNDERISRFHIKIQEDNNMLVLTDLDSTNGTRVNGQDCQLRILRYGDIIALGRSVILFGTREEIAGRLQDNLSSSGDMKLMDKLRNAEKDADFDMSTALEASYNILASHTRPPGVPERLTPAQLAQLSELLDFVHARLGTIVDASKIDDKVEEVQIDGATWQVILSLYSRIAELIRSLGEPDMTTPG